MRKQSYLSMTQEQMREQLELLTGEYNGFKEMGLSLDMSRGKPCKEQLELSNGLYEELTSGFTDTAGVDVRNYGELTGIYEMKEIFSLILGVDPQDIFVGGSSSLSLMFDTISRMMTHGGVHSPQPWAQCKQVKFLCPVPGYDRHFSITEHFGIEMISVPMDESGPDMGMIESLVHEDASIKGIWCVPLYSNPGGAIYSDGVVERLASMRCAAEDFTIMWDNAYAVHSLYGSVSEQLNLYHACKEAGNPDRAVLFASTSKITFSGSGVACIAGSPEMLSYCKKTWTVQTIGHNKINQLAHARFLNRVGIFALMEKHAEILRPKFKIVDEIFTDNLQGLDVATWSKPLGGYFINLQPPKGTASRIVQLCAQANVQLTPAGAAFPYGIDPSDSNIRIAPSFPSEEELAQSAQLLCVCLRMAALEKMLETQE